MIKESILSTIDECIEIQSKRIEKNKLELAEWKRSVTRLFEERTESITNKYINTRSSTTTLNTFQYI